MLPPEKQTALDALLAGTSPEELAWINGYIAGVLSANSKAVLPQGSSPVSFNGKITLAYGTETGNAQSLAMRLATLVRKQGIAIKVVSLDQYRLAALPEEAYFIVVISTQGEGEPPVSAKKFYHFIHDAGLSLKTVNYAVLALGDSAYPLFCQAGVDVDRQLNRAGAKCIADLVKCDTDYEQTAMQWMEAILGKLRGTEQRKAASAVSIAQQGGKRLYSGTVLSNVNLNDEDSDKQTHHIEIATEGIVYLPGDTLSVIPENPLQMIQDIISISGISVDDQIVYRGTESKIADLLAYTLNIAWLSERTIKQYADIVVQDIPDAKISLIDLLKIYPVKNVTQFREVIGILEPLTPRQYSIASSPGAHGTELHLIVARDTFLINKERKYGLCSNYLSQLVEGQKLRFHIHSNKRFRLAPPDKDIIMISAGTGIAPFRSFLWERETTMAPGRNWLFFGDRRFTSDFLYQTEVQNWIATGLLTRFNAAFSRDQQEKLYVQHKMELYGAALWQWLEEGAHFYICGAKEPMSKDVEQTLVQVIQKHGCKMEQEALQYLEQLSGEGRYLKDVY